MQAIRRLLTRIEDAVPLINLAITASGASLSSSLPSTVSPSRLLQASTFLTAGDSQYGVPDATHVQIGPVFTLSMYMLFTGHIRPQNEDEIRQSTWKEIIHKADVRLMRVPINALYDLPGTTLQASPMHYSNGDHLASSAKSAEDGCTAQGSETEIKSDEYAYQLIIVEDLDDDRMHAFEDDQPLPTQYADIPNAGIREVVPIHELSKIFYADTGKILNIGSEGEANSPVLLLKRDPNAVPPRRMMDNNGRDDDHDDGVLDSPDRNSHDNGQALITTTQKESTPSAPSTPSKDQQVVQAPDPWRLPPDLDPEWMAFEVYTEAEDSDDESETNMLSFDRPSSNSRSPSVEAETVSALSRLNINSPSTPASSPKSQTTHAQPKPQPQPSLPPIRTSLSLLETLLRLLSLQQFQQTPHLSIPDELLNFFLSESASTGAASNDVQERKRLREEARRRVGFDPYDESPVKRRGEEYQYRSRGVDGGREGSPSQSYGSYSGQEQYNQYGSPLRYEDEGYGTYQSYPHSLPVTPRDLTPQTPPLLLTNRSRSNTPSERSSVPSPSARLVPSRRRWVDGKGGLRQGADNAGRKGSPLAKSATGIIDEGLGTSPESVKNEHGEEPQ